jgi:hypothetical protein
LSGHFLENFHNLDRAEVTERGHALHCLLLQARTTDEVEGRKSAVAEAFWFSLPFGSSRFFSPLHLRS